jgi:septum site-determining protein MinD
MISEGDMMDKDDVMSLLSVRVIGVVPDDSQVIIATNKGLPVVHDAKSLSGEAFRRIAARLDGEDVPFLDLDERKGMMSRIKGMFGSNGNGVKNGYNHA